MSAGFSLSRIFSNKQVKSAEVFKRVHIAADGTLEQEGQLAVDIYQTDNEIVVLAPLAGVSKEDIDLKIVDDIITISGKRSKPLVSDNRFLIQECFWGNFSRSIILPAPAEGAKVKAAFKNGLLTINIPKSDRLKTKVIKIED